MGSILIAIDLIAKQTRELEFRKKEAVEQHIVLEARKWGVDERLALDISKCESGYNPLAVGDFGASRGIWQINRPAWPKITDEQAHSVEWSTSWAMQKMKEGKHNIWSCFKLVASKGG